MFAERWHLEEAFTRTHHLAVSARFSRQRRLARPWSSVSFASLLKQKRHDGAFCCLAATVAVLFWFCSQRLRLSYYYPFGLRKCGSAGMPITSHVRTTAHGVVLVLCLGSAYRTGPAMRRARGCCCCCEVLCILVYLRYLWRSRLILVPAWTEKAIGM